MHVATSGQLQPGERAYLDARITALAAALGRPASRNEISTARSDDVAVVQALELLNGPEIQELIDSSLLVAPPTGKPDPKRLVDRVYRAIAQPAGNAEEKRLGQALLGCVARSFRWFERHCLGLGGQSGIPIHQVDRFQTPAGTARFSQQVEKPTVTSCTNDSIAETFSPAAWLPVRRAADPSALAPLGRSALAATSPRVPLSPATADSVIMIWLPGGVCQTDCWDVKRHTPFETGMRGNQILGTCPSIPTAVDGLRFGEGLEQIASVMDRGTLVRSLTSQTKFGAVHLKAQYYMMTGYLFPAGVKAPSFGAAVARTLGPRAANVPPYIYIGRDVDTSDTEKQFIHEFIGPGFYGIEHAPFMIPDPAAGLATLHAAAGISNARLDRRIEYLHSVHKLSAESLQRSDKVAGYLGMIDQARAMMDSPVKRAFAYAKEETPATLAAYEPQIGSEDLLDKNYFYGRRFGQGLLLARRLVERAPRSCRSNINTARSRVLTPTKMAGCGWPK